MNKFFTLSLVAALLVGVSSVNADKVVHLTDGDFAEKVGDGKVSLRMIFEDSMLLLISLFVFLAALFREILCSMVG